MQIGIGIGVNQRLGNLINEEFIIPSSWSWFTNKLIWRGGRTITTDYDFNTVKNSVTGNEKWVDPINGSNANDGNSELTPYQTLAYAYTTGAGRRFHVKAGSIFTYATGFQATALVQAISIDLYGGTDDAYLTTAAPMVYSLDGVLTNTYVANGAANAFDINLVFDITYKDANDSEIKYIRQTSAASVNTTPGSYYYDAGADLLYVRTWDSRVPDSSLYACMGTVTAIPTNNTSHFRAVHAEHIRFYGGRAVEVNAAVAQARRQVSFHYCRAMNGGGNGGFFIRNNADAYLYKCVADYGDADGFNYQDTCRALEWYCKSNQSGRDLTSESNNGSTGHASCSVISVGGEHYTSRGKLVQFIGASKGWYIAPICGNSLAAQGDDDTAAFATDSTQPGTTELRIYLGQTVGRPTDLKFWNFPTSVINCWDGPIGNVNGTPKREDVGSTFNVLTDEDVFV